MEVELRTMRRDKEDICSPNKPMHFQDEMPRARETVPVPIKQHAAKGKFWKRFGPFMGLFHTLLNAAFYTIYAAMVKKITSFSPGLLNFTISMCILTGTIPMAVLAQRNVFGPRQHRFFTFLRALCLESAIICSIMGYRLLPLMEFSIIWALTPAVSILSARVLLKEPCGVAQSCCLIIALVGVLVSVRLPKLMQSRGDEHFTYAYASGIAYTVAAVFSVAFSHLLVRATRTVHHCVHLMYMGVIGLIVSVCLTASMTFKLPHCGWDPYLLLSSGLFNFVGMIFGIMALQSEAVAIVVIINASCSVVMAMLFQVIFFGEVPDIYNVSGAILVMIATIAIGTNKWLRQLPTEKEHIKKQLKFLLM